MPGTTTDNYTRQAETFRSKIKSQVQLPVSLVGAHTRTYKGTPQSLAVTGTGVVNLTVPVGADFAEVYFSGATATTDYIRFWHGSTDPTSTSGIEMVDGDTYITASPSTISFIKGASGGGGTVHVEYFSYE